MRRALTRRDLQGIDPAKLGPDSPLRQLISTRTKPRADHEHEEQCKLFAWARENEDTIPELHWLFAVPNFSGRIGKLTARQGARLKAEGRKPGVPDVILAVARYSRDSYERMALAIEMKYGRNTLSKEQKEWVAHLRDDNWSVAVCYSFEEARDVILAYLAEKGD